MKNYLLFLPLLLLNISAFSQTPYWEWTNSALSSTGNMEDRPVSIVTDSEGFIYSTGHFKSSSMTFGAITLSNTSESLSSDVFLAKYSPTGEVIWAKSFGGQSYERVADIAVDANGDLFVTGQFRSDTFSIGQTTLINNGADDIFLFKCNPQGEVIWAKNIGGSTDDQGVGLAVDPIGNIILVSDFESPSVTVGSETFLNSLYYPGYGRDILICKYDGNGNLIWAKTLTGDSAESVSDVAVDSDGNIVVSGKFHSPILTDGDAVMTNDKVAALFVIKYSASGSFLWSDSWAGSSSNNGRSVSTDGEGNVLLLANLGGDLVTFDSITLTMEAKSSAIVKYDQNGNAIWATIVAESKTHGASLATDSDGNVFLATHSICDDLQFGGVTFSNYGSNDIVFIKYDKWGNEVWGISPTEGYSDDICTAISIDKRGHAVLAGFFLSDNLAFGETTLGHDSALQAGTFVAKLNTASTVDVKDQVSDEIISVYPNPSAGDLRINLGSKFQNGTVSVFNQLGCLLDKQNLNSSNFFDYQFPENTKGIYLIQLRHPDGFSETLKAVRQ
jgi:hypothetical protein